MYIEAETALVNHRDTRAIMTRFEVTSSWYRRWRKIERSLSTAMAVIFRNVAKPGRAIAKYKESKMVGQNESKPRKSSVDDIFNITAMTAAVAGWENIPTAISETARLKNIFFALAGIDEAFHNA